MEGNTSGGRRGRGRGRGGGGGEGRRARPHHHRHPRGNDSNQDGMDTPTHSDANDRGKRRRGGGRGRGGPRQGRQGDDGGDLLHHKKTAATEDAANGDDAEDDGSYQPPLTEAVPDDTPRFGDLTDPNMVNPTIVKTITEDLKFDHMMPVQAATLPELLPPKRSDCLVQAKTGTGKTVAFLLPALQTLIKRSEALTTTNNGRISLLVISPTRELALQIAKEATNLLQRLPKFKVCVAIGGTNKDQEERKILSGCDVLIATPGRLLDHMNEERIIWEMQALDTLVLDEADRLLDMGFKRDLTEIVRRLPDKQKTKRQGMLFSATIAPHVNEVANLVLSPGYKFISTIPEGEANTHERVPQILIKVDRFADVAPAMVTAVREELARHGAAFKAIVFAPTAVLAGLYGDILASIGPNGGRALPPVMTLHSRMTQNRRTKITNDYRTSTSAVLAATDVIARGMDFPGVTTVFQVGVPADRESYIHRLGRTARAGAEGRGIFIVTEYESWFPRWTLKDVTFIPHDPIPAATSAAAYAEVEQIVVKMEDEDKARIYQAWLGYYKNHLKPLGWDRNELVRQGNVYAREGLGSPDTPTIFKSTVSKMGLKGTPGLNVVPDPKRHPGQKPGGGGRAPRGKA